jgi:hypothetical protein
MLSDNGSVTDARVISRLLREAVTPTDVVTYGAGAVFGYAPADVWGVSAMDHNWFPAG